MCVCVSVSSGEHIKELDKQLGNGVFLLFTKLRLSRQGTFPGSIYQLETPY